MGMVDHLCAYGEKLPHLSRSQAPSHGKRNSLPLSMMYEHACATSHYTRNVFATTHELDSAYKALPQASESVDSND